MVAAYTADDLGDYWKPGPLLVPPPLIAGIVFHQRTQVPLAKHKVRHVGEPLVIVDLRHALDFEADPETIPGAFRMDAKDLEKKDNRLPHDREVILYCT